MTPPGAANPVGSPDRISKVPFAIRRKIYESPPSAADVLEFRAQARPQPSALPLVLPPLKFKHARCGHNPLREVGQANGVRWVAGVWDSSQGTYFVKKIATEKIFSGFEVHNGAGGANQVKSALFPAPAIRLDFRPMPLGFQPFSL